MLPVVLLVVLWVLSSLLSEGPVYALSPTRSLSVERVVLVRSDAAGEKPLKYYVGEDFRRRAPDRRAIAKVERDVLMDYAAYYERQCGMDQRRVQGQQMWASAKRYQELERERLSLPSCGMYTMLRDELQQR